MGSQKIENKPETLNPKEKTLRALGFRVYRV